MPTTFFIEQFGCRATQADAAAIERQLLDRGCTPALAAADAEVVVVNTCTVTAAADTQARDAIRKIHASNPAAQIVATGCYAQRAPEDLAALCGVTMVVGNSHKNQLAELVASFGARSISATQSGFVPLENLSLGENLPLVVAKTGRGEIIVDDIFAHSHFLSAPVLGGEAEHTRPTLKIQDGCDLRCTYCVIPFVRGKSRSMIPDDVVAEVRRLSDSGFREIVLSGINLGTYGRDLSPRAELLDLLRRILDEASIERLRLSSIEPQDVTQDLIDLFATNDRLADHFHIPLQSGSDRILAAMHRWYRTDHYARRVKLIRDRLPHAAIGADVIAGFPGETEADHAATLAFIERLPFTYLHVFSYSQRSGTKATALPNQIPANIIKRRAGELRALGEKKLSEFHQSQSGRTLRVLTLRAKARETEESAGFFTPAISSNYARVQISGGYAPNEFRQVQITGIEGSHLVAVESAT